MCDPLDVDKLTQLVQQGLLDDAWRAKAREAGLAHTAGFSWSRCAAQTMQVYRTVLDAT
ncbi:hypothetical protein D3C85_1847260 [compost metagenome]